MRLHQRFERLHFHPKLALVVDRAARVNVVVALRRFKRRRVPFVDRIGRLNVVMGIHQDGGLARRMQPVGIKQRMTLGGYDLDVFHSDAAQLVGHKFCCLLHVAFMFFEGANAGNAEESFEFV